MKERVLALVAILALLGIAPTSDASTQLMVFVLGGSSDDQGAGSNFNDFMTSGAGSLSFGGAASSPGGSSVASGTVGFGWARSLSTASHSAPDLGIGSSSNASAQALFRDDLTITAPGISGGGSVIFLIDVSGSLVAQSSAETPSVNADSGWNAFADTSTMSGSRIGEGAAFDGSAGFSVTGDPTGGTYQFGPIPFSFGFPFEILVALNTDADVDFCCTGAASFDSTLTWEGVLEIRDGGGTLITTASISSVSGADYGAPIPAPEPMANALALASLVTVACVRLQRRARRSAGPIRAISRRRAPPQPPRRTR